ncbi:MAG: MFS transporter [Rhodospirillaceae bacterium]
MSDNTEQKYGARLQAAVYGTAFFNGTVQSMASTIVALLLVAAINPDLTFLIGLIIAARQFLTVTMSIYGGALMDQFGTRQVIIWVGFLGIATSLAFPMAGPVFGVEGEAISQTPPWGFVVTLIILQMLSGYAEATGWIGSQTLVGQLMKGHPVYAGRMTFVARIGGFIGPIAVGAAWDHLGAWGGFGFLAVWIAGGVIAASFLPDLLGGMDNVSDQPSKKDKSLQESATASYSSTLRLLLIPAIAMVIMITVMRQTGSGVQSSFYVVWLREEIHLSGSLIGLLIGSANAASAGAALTIGPLTRVIADHWLLIIMIGISIVFIAITPLLGDFFPLLLLAICCRGIGQGLNLPLMMTILARNVGPSQQGRVTGMRISFNRFGGMCVPPLMGGLAEIVGLANSFYIVGLVGVIALCGLSLWVANSPGFKEQGEKDGPN